MNNETLSQPTNIMTKISQDVSNFMCNLRKTLNDIVNSDKFKQWMDCFELYKRKYTKEGIDSILNTWNNYNFLDKRISALKECLYTFNDGYHYASICLLFTQIEGIINDHCNKKNSTSKLKKEINIMVDIKYSDDEDAKYFFKDVVTNFLYENYNNYSEDCPEFSRHSIIHGYDTSYNSDFYNLILLELLSVIIDVIYINKNKKYEKD